MLNESPHCVTIFKRMVTRKPGSSHFLSKTRRRAITSCTLEVEREPLANVASASQSTFSDHKMFCFSLADQLINRGLIASAQQVIQRLIANSASLSDALSAADFAAVRGMRFDSGSYSALMKKLIKFGQSQSALLLYQNDFVALGIDPDPAILNSVIIGYCKLGNIEDALRHFDRLISKNIVPIKLACVSILRGLFAEEKFLEAFDYFIKICNAGVDLNCWSYNVLIDGLCYKGFLDEVLEVVNIMRKKKGLVPALHPYKSLFYALCKNRRTVEAESFAREMESQGFYVDKLMYTSLINGYCSNRNMKMAMRLFFRMLKTGCEPDSYTCNTLIHGFFKMGLFDKGWVLYSQMSDWGFQPNMVTDLIMISNYCREGEVDAALMLLNSKVSSNLAPSVHCYTVLIDALYKHNRLMEVDELYKKMLANRVAPDHLLSFILLKNCPEGTELQHALMLLCEFAKIGCGIDPLARSISATLNPTGDLCQEIELLLRKIVKSDPKLANVAFTIYISALCKGGKYEKAYVCLFQLVNFGYRPLVFTCNTLIKCFYQVGFLEGANAIVELMQDTGTVADVETYLIMVEGNCKWGNLDSALDILDQMEVRGPKPSVAIYDAIIGHLCKEKRILEAEDMFKRMLKAGIDPDEVFFTTMINGYLQNRKPIEACQLFEKMKENSVQPGSYPYTALISGLVKKGMVDLGCMYLDRMLADGFVPNVVLYTALINHFLRAGEFEFASRLENLMVTNQIEFDLIAYIALVSGVCRRITGRKKWLDVNRCSDSGKEMLFHKLQQGTLVTRTKSTAFSAVFSNGKKGTVQKIVLKVKDIEFMPNLYLYNDIFLLLCGVGRMDDAYDHFQMMKREGLRPNQVTFCILINGHIAAGEIDQAIGLFNQMNADGCVPDKTVYNTLLKGLCQAGRLSHVFSVFYSMHKRGFVPKKATYEHLLECFCANCLSIPAFNMFKEMIVHDHVPCLSNCNWLLNILFQEKHFHEAQIVLDVMHKRGRLPCKSTRGFWRKHFIGKEKFNF